MRALGGVAPVLSAKDQRYVRLSRTPPADLPRWQAKAATES